jgi:arginine decarboxylase
VREVLNYVQFSSDSLVTKLRRDVESALRDNRLTYEESGALLKFYEEGLRGYTYLEDVHEQ